jgi:hypothetical protein
MRRLTICADSPRLAPDRPLAGLQILVVDDDNDAREFQAFVLEASSASVTALASSPDALDVLDLCSRSVNQRCRDGPHG